MACFALSTSFVLRKVRESAYIAPCLMMNVGDRRRFAGGQHLSVSAGPKQKPPRKIVGSKHREWPQEQQRPNDVKARVECSREVRTRIYTLLGLKIRWYRPRT